MPLSIIVLKHDRDIVIDGDMVSKIAYACDRIPFVEDGGPVLMINPDYDPGKRTFYTLTWAAPSKVASRG